MVSQEYPRRKYIAMVGSALLTGLSGCSDFYGNQDTTNERTTNERWTFEVNGDIWSSPVVSEGTVYVGSSFSMYALDVNSGEQEWKIDVDRRPRTPLVIDDTIYFGAGGITYNNEGEPEGVDGGVYAVNSDTGEVQWNFTTGLEMLSPVVMDETVYINSHDPFHPPNPSIYAINTTDGTKEWSAGSPPISTPFVTTDNLLFLCDENGIHAIDPRNGKEKWRSNIYGSVSLSAADGTVYSGNSGGLHALTAVDGTRQWRSELNNPREITAVSPVADGTLYATDLSNLYAVDAESGRRQWDLKTDGSIQVLAASRTGIGVGSDSVYFGNQNGTIYAVDKNGGDLRWQYETGGEVNYAPTIKNGTVYIGSSDGNLYALSDND
jgi:outer membrane protein assembly factor BamB